MKRLPISFALFLLFHPAPVRGDDALTVQATAWQSADELIVDFIDDGTGEAAEFTVERSPDMGEASWSLYGDVSLEATPGGWRVTIPVPADGVRGFFRVLKGAEPVTAAFGGESASLVEGGASQGVTVQLSAPFSGTLRYTIDYGDGAGSRAGEVYIDGADTALLPVTGLSDDADAEASRYLTVRIEAAPEGGTSYRPVAAGLSVLVDDNDAYWGGALDLGDADLNVRLLVTKQGGLTTGALVTDGAGIMPVNPATPDGSWPFDWLVSDATVFRGQTSRIVIPAEDTAYGAVTEITIAVSSEYGEVREVTAGRIRGQFTMLTTVPSLPHLQFPTRNGPFVLLREAAAPKDLEPPQAP